VATSSLTSSAAALWLAVLAARRMPDQWRHLAKASANVKTVLKAIGSHTTLDLIERSATLTQLQFHIHYGIGAVSAPARREHRCARFTD
jgi:hypothetical protein